MLNLRIFFFTCLVGINIVASNYNAKECLEAAAARDACDCNGDISFRDNGQIGARFLALARASMKLKLCRRAAEANRTANSTES